MLIVSGVILGILTAIIIRNIGVDGKLPSLFFQFFLLFVPTACLALNMFIAKRKIIYADCFGTVYMSGCAIVLLGLVITDWIKIDMKMRN